MRRLYFILSILGALSSNASTYNVRSFGASGKRGEYATQSIQKAIDRCMQSGGGIVFFPAGEYLSSTVRLKDNVTLYLAAGARLIASNRESDYTDFVTLNDTGGGGVPMLIYAESVRNIAIKGEGSIEGQPEYYTVPLSYSPFIAEDCDAAMAAGVEMTASKWKKPNVSLVFLSKCTNVRMEGVSLLNSPFWTFHAHWCERLFVRGVYIYSRLGVAANSDGLDIDGCTEVTVSDCIIETGDDAICLKTTLGKEGTRRCENVVVNNCILTSSSCALKLGTESHADFKNILFSNCVIRNSNRGLGIFIRDGGTAENVSFANIRMECRRYPVSWWGSADAFRFVVLKRNKDSQVGAIRNLLLRDIQAEVQGSSRLIGFEGTHTIQGVKLENLDITISPEPCRDKRTKEGLTIANAEEVDLRRITLRWTGEVQSTWSHSLVLRNVFGVTEEDIRLLNQPHGLESVLREK